MQVGQHSYFFSYSYPRSERKKESHGERGSEASAAVSIMTILAGVVIIGWGERLDSGGVIDASDHLVTRPDQISAAIMLGEIMANHVAEGYFDDGRNVEHVQD
jgi:Ca2+/H+ antiporter